MASATAEHLNRFMIAGYSDFLLPAWFIGGVVMHRVGEPSISEDERATREGENIPMRGEDDRYFPEEEWNIHFPINPARFPD